MAKQETVWRDNAGVTWTHEITALTEDFYVAAGDEYALSPALIAAIDALHEYAHRGEREVDALVEEYKDVLNGLAAHDSGTTLPEGVPPELDDWVKRWAWITARVTEDAIKSLRKGDEARIGLTWYAVYSAYSRTVTLDLKDEDGITLSCFTHSEALSLINEVRYNGR